MPRLNVEAIVRLAVEAAVYFEGVYLRPYLCPAGIPTIGVGCTQYENGRRVTLNDPPITRERAMQLLDWRIRNEFLPKVMRLCPELETEEQFAAICDFTFNLGVGRLQASTLRKVIRAREGGRVREELLKWNRAAGRVLRGLTRRRWYEVFLGGW